MSARAPKAQKFDLSTPAPLAPEVQRRIEAQRVVLAEALRLQLRRLLRTRVDVQVDAPVVARVGSLADFQDGKAWWLTGGPTDQAEARQVLVGVAPALIYSSIDRTLGGPGETSLPDRPPTAIEVELGGRFLSGVFDGVAAGLQLPPLRLRIARLARVDEPLSTFLREPEEPVVRLPVTVVLPYGDQQIVVSLSHAMLASVLPKEGTKTTPSRPLSRAVTETRTTMVAELARCSLTLEEAAALAPGDVVMFTARPGDPVALLVQDRARFEGRLGVHGGHYAVEVSSVREPVEPVEPTEQPPAKTPATRPPRKGAAQPSPSRGAEHDGQG